MIGSGGRSFYWIWIRIIMTNATLKALNRAVDAQNMGEIKLATDIYRTILKKEPNNAVVNNNLGLSLIHI